MGSDDMTPRKGRMFAIFGVGIAAMIGAWTFSSDTLSSSITAVIFVCVGVTCMFIAGNMARKINKDTAAK